MASGVNYLTIKLIIIVIINAATIAGYKSAWNYYRYQQLIISPNTPVYYVEPLDDGQVNVITRLNKFKASHAYKYYNDPQTDRSDTFVVNLLLIFDNYDENSQFNESRHLNKILDDFSIASRSFSKLNDPKIKLHISGVIKWKHVNTTDFTKRHEASSGSYDCYDLYQTYTTLNRWLYKNPEIFAMINHDMFIFVTNKDLCHPNDKSSNVVLSYQRENIDCMDRITLKDHVGGLLYSGGDFVGLSAVLMIAHAFGVKNDSMTECKSDSEDFDHYYMNPKGYEIEGISRYWSECSKADFQKIVDNKQYECLKMPTTYDESGYNNLILGPDTYIYTVDVPRKGHVRILSDLNRFWPTPTYNDYKKPDVNLSNTYVINILLIYDWSLRGIHGERTNVLDPILHELSIVAANFNKLEHIKLKLRISGILFPPKSDTFTLPETQNMSQWNQPCYHSRESLRYVSEWLQKNGEQFENPSFDFFLFLASKHLCDDNTKWKIDTFALQKYDCNDTPSLVKSSGALVQYDMFFSSHVTRLIAHRFGVTKDDVLHCGSGHIMDYKTIRNRLPAINPRSWSSCSQSAFQSIPRTPAYSCYKMPAFNPDSEEYGDYQ